MEPNNVLLHVSDVGVDRTRLAVAGFLARYRGATRINYQSDLRCYLAWCHDVNIHPVELSRPQLELWMRHMEEQQHLAPATIARRLNGLGDVPVRPHRRPHRHQPG